MRGECESPPEEALHESTRQRQNLREQVGPLYVSTEDLLANVPYMDFLSESGRTRLIQIIKDRRDCVTVRLPSGENVTGVLLSIIERSRVDLAVEHPDGFQPVRASVGKFLSWQEHPGEFNKQVIPPTNAS